MSELVADRARGRRFVLLGEASHGTHEFYALRAEITKRLLDELGFDAVAAEADWPDAYRVAQYVLGESGDADANEALSDFRRFPSWMWRNQVVRGFVEWLRDRNDGHPEPAGFYGLDLYSLHASIEAVLRYLDETDPQAAARARERYACFEHFDPELAPYIPEACEDAAVQQLVEMQRRAAQDGRDAFAAEMNARVVVDAERYYRAMFRGRASSWNLRDRHMADTLWALDEYISRERGRPARIAVWAHNSHLGDARATEMSRRGELNLGQLVRERYGDEALLVGFSTYTGTVTAATDWGGIAERKYVRPAPAGSWEEAFHRRGGDFVLEPRDVEGELLERAIGVIYRPETERQSHYFHARLRDQFDVLIHVDETHALEPLERTSEWEAGELPETYPYAV